MDRLVTQSPSWRGGSGAPAALGLGQVRGTHALDDWNELQVAGPQIIAEVAVHPLPVLLVRGVDRAQDVRLHARAGERLPAAHNHRVGAAPAAVEPVGVVQGSGSVNGDPHEEAVVGEKLRPLVGHQRAVRLQGMTHALGGATVALAQLDEALKKGQATQGRLPTLPQHRDLAVGARLQELLDVTLQSLLGHGLRRRVVEQLLGQEKTILTIQVAGSPRRFGDDGERDRSRHSRSPRTTLALIDEAGPSRWGEPSSGQWGGAASSSKGWAAIYALA